MANMIQNAKDSVNALLAAACAKAVEKGQLPAGAVLSGTVEIPKDTSNGDYAANHAMAGARALREKLVRDGLCADRNAGTARFFISCEPSHFNAFASRYLEMGPVHAEQTALMEL